MSARGQEVLLEVTGSQAVDSIASTDVVADIDRMGSPDLLIGGGPPNGLVWVVSTETGAVIRSTDGPVSGHLGQMVASLGDFDGDRFPDYAAGAKHAPDGFAGYGMVRVFSGATGDTVVDIPGPPIGNYQMGRMLDSAGDVNGDGYADLVTCGIQLEARVYAGPDGSLIRSHPGPGGRPSVAGVGDMDGDGYDDYAVGWPQDSTMGCWVGRVTVYSGLDGSPIHSVYGSTPCGGGFLGDHFGLSISGLGDVNGDDVPDFLVGAPGGLWEGGGGGAGYVRGFSGGDGSLLYEVRAETTDAIVGFGYRVSGGADANGDGVPDFIVGGIEDNNGQVLLEFGSMAVYCGASGEMIWKRFGPSVHNWYGRHVSMLTDLDGDGFAEFAVSDALWDQPALAAGRVVVYRGGRGLAQRYCASNANSTGAPGRIELLGPISVGNDRLTLSARDLPPGQFGLFVYGDESAGTPFGDGTLCVGGALFRVGSPSPTDATGRFDEPLGFNEPPANAGPGQIDPGETWYFQCWYRDPSGPGGNGFNVSDAFEILFAL